MLRYVGLWLPLLGFTLAGCGVGTRPGTTAELPDACTAPGANTAGWVTVDTGPFSFTAPAEYRRQNVQGIDSFVGQWSASRRRVVAFDWGMYSGSLAEEYTPLQGFRACTTEIDGRRARVVTGYDSAGTWSSRGRKYVVAAAWRDVHPGAHLTLSATSEDGADIPALLSIIRSVRFTGNPAAP